MPSAVAVRVLHLLQVGLVLSLLACASPAAAAAVAAPKYTPLVISEGAAEPSVWLGRVERSGTWCVLDRAGFDRRDTANELSADVSGWARYGSRGLESITIRTQSEEAYLEDRYFIGSDGAVVRLIRTGRYLDHPLASFLYLPDATGKLALADTSKVSLQRMKSANYEVGFLDWPYYARLADMPFGDLLKPASAKPPKVRCPAR